MFNNIEQLQRFIEKEKNTKLEKKVNLTKLEEQVIKIISKGDYFEDMPTQSFSVIMDYFSGTKHQLKGVLSSLFCKNIIMEGEYPNGMIAYHLIE